MDETMLYWGLALLAVSLLLAGCEVFIPSAGLISVVSFGCGVTGIIFLFRVDWRWGAAGLGTMAVLVPMVVLFSLNMLPHTTVGKRLLFGQSGREEPVLADDTGESARTLLGLEGEVLTDLRPVGQIRVQVAGEPAPRTLEVLSEMAFVQAGQRVRITEIAGSQIKVRRV